MIAGQKLRGQKIAKKHGRNLSIVPLHDKNVLDASTEIVSSPDKKDKVSYTANPFISKKTQSTYLASALKEKGKDHLSRKDIRKQFLRINNQKNPNLTAADILAHEIDEYGSGLELGKKLNIPVNKIYAAAGLHHAPGSTYVQSTRSSHFPGVLEREAKRNHLINTLYGRDAFSSMARDSKQFALNKKKHILNNSLTKDFSKRNNLDPEVRKNWSSNSGKTYKKRIF